ncbi:cathelicidin-3-like [Zootoca vivipara]|uniref:cathelicidin-3-like n=1 Tax=Zootoca vivipara TaxID=8524 RepID=UPI00159031EB|nr:cathelicidin-3-like [Zootoca vivipara]
MVSYWGILLLISLATAQPQGTLGGFQEALAQAIYFYNQGPQVQNAFRLLDATQIPRLNSSSGNLQPLNFTIQETVCPTSVVWELCDFKPEGLVKDCSGYFSNQQANSVTVITCDAAVRKPTPVTRFRFLGRLLRGIGRGFKFWGNNNNN